MAIRAVVKGLQAYLDSNVVALAKVYDQWPAANEKLVYPALTIMAKEPKFIPAMPYVIAKTGAALDVSKTVTKVVGQYEFALQMDLWCTYRPQRDSVYEDIFSAFNLNSDVHGISIQLTEYYNQWCHFSIEGINYVGDDSGVERGEWRATIRVVATVNAVNQKVTHTMQIVENTLETPEEIAEPAAGVEVLRI